MGAESTVERVSARVGGARSVLRWLVAHQAVSAGLLLGLFVLAYLWPVLIGGDILSPRSTLFQFAPWAATAPPDFPEFTSFYLGDVPMSHYPWNVLAREFIHDGTFPAWSQHAYAGVPFFANPQTLLLSPFSVPMWIFPLDYGIGVSAALKLWFAAFGAYLLVRELQLGFWPGILAGVSYALSSFGVLWLGHETLLTVAVMLPWMVWLAERTLVGGRLGPAVGFAVATAVMLTGGHPGTMVHVACATGIYALIRAFTVRDVARRERARRLALVAAGGVVGALLVAVLLVPVVRAGAGTIGAEARIGENETIPGAKLPFETIKTTLFPDWWGRPSAQSIEGPANYNERTFFAGGVATLFALIAVVTAGAWRRKAAFAVLALIGLAVPLHAPGLYWLAKNLPLLGQVQHQRIMLLYVFGVALLAAFGLQWLIDAARSGELARRRVLARPVGVLAAAALVGLVALAAAGVSGSDVGAGLANIAAARHAVGELVTGLPPNSGELVATTVIWWLAMVVVVAALVLVLWRRPRAAVVVAGFVALVAAIDLLYFARDYQPMQPAERITPPRTAAIAWLQERADLGRMVGVDDALLNDWSATYGLRDVRGYDPPQPSLRWFRLWQSHVHPGQLDWGQAQVPSTTLRQSGLNVLSVMGVRYVVAPPGVDLAAALPDLRAGYEGEDATVYVNPLAVPRATVAPSVLVTEDEYATISAIGDPAFAPRDVAVVERGEPGAEALASSAGGGTVTVTDEANAAVTLEATLDAPGLVVLNDALAPGWSVRVDGEDADVVRVNGVMRGVAVDAGRHEVAWSYAVPGLKLGAGLSVAGLVLLALGLWRATAERRRAVASPGARS